MQSAEEMVEASTGLAPVNAREPRESGFESDRVANYLDRNAQALEAAASDANDIAASTLATTAVRLRELAVSMRDAAPLALDELDRTLTVLEDKLLAALQSSASAGIGRSQIASRTASCSPIEHG